MAAQTKSIKEYCIAHASGEVVFAFHTRYLDIHKVYTFCLNESNASSPHLVPQVHYDKSSAVAKPILSGARVGLSCASRTRSYSTFNIRPSQDVDTSYFRVNKFVPHWDSKEV